MHGCTAPGSCRHLARRPMTEAPKTSTQGRARGSDRSGIQRLPEDEDSVRVGQFGLGVESAGTLDLLISIRLPIRSAAGCSQETQEHAGRRCVLSCIIASLVHAFREHRKQVEPCVLIKRSIGSEGHLRSLKNAPNQKSSTGTVRLAGSMSVLARPRSPFGSPRQAQVCPRFRSYCNRTSA